MPEYLTVHELAMRWKYDTDKPVYEMKDKIGFVRIGGRILFEMKDILKYEAANKTEPEVIGGGDGNES